MEVGGTAGVKVKCHTAEEPDCEGSSPGVTDAEPVVTIDTSPHSNMNTSAVSGYNKWAVEKDIW